jgi:hypothetical protein
MEYQSGTVTDVQPSRRSRSAKKEILRRRLAAQRIAKTEFTRPAEIVGWLGAVQAQDYLGALWSRSGFRRPNPWRAKKRCRSSRADTSRAMDRPRFETLLGGPD